MWRTGGTARRLAPAAMAVLALVVGCTNPPGRGGAPPTTTLVPLADPPGTFSVLSYNVAGLPQEISKVNPERNIPLISPRLNAYDVVLTQEDFDWWQPLLNSLSFAQFHTTLRADADHPYRSGEHPGPFAVGLDPLSRPLFVGDGLGMMARYPFTEPVRVPWRSCFGGILPPGAADCLAMKGFSVATMTLADGRLVDVYNLHGEAGGTPEDQRLQAEGFEQLAEFIVAHSAGRAVVLAGDTNLHTDGVNPDAGGDADRLIWEAFLARTGLIDTCIELGCPTPGLIDKAAYRDGDGVDLTPTSHTYPRADFRDDEGGDLSDHPPLVVVFDWDAA
jgi:hypothetical protein